jgi:hypothetical protein
MLQHVEAGERVENLRMNILQAIQFIVQAWSEISAETIRNCWGHTKILPDLGNLSENEDLLLDDLTNTLQALKLSNAMQVEEFLNIPEENIIYEVPDSDHELVYLFKNTNQETADSEEIDDSQESPVISASTAITCLQTVRAFLLQQDNAEKYISLLQNIDASNYH